MERSENRRYIASVGVGYTAIESRGKLTFPQQNPHFGVLSLLHITPEYFIMRSVTSGWLYATRGAVSFSNDSNTAFTVQSNDAGDSVKIVRWVLAVLIAGFVLIQFVRPDINIQKRSPGTGLSDLYPIPDSVHQVLIVACLDCHSDSTRYPWYASLQPARWYLSGHVRDGRRNLNFDEFATYRPFRQFGKLFQIERQLEEGEMPLSSYLLIHRDAVLSQQQKDLLIAWSRSLRDSLRQKYPPDSLERRRPGGVREGGMGR